MAVEFSATEEAVDARTRIVTVRGEVDIFTAPEFKALIAAAIDTECDAVLVDFEGATFLDSSSLGVLISAQRRLSMREGRLIIACSVPAVRNTFKITGLDSVLELVDTRADALAAADSASPAA